MNTYSQDNLIMAAQTDLRQSKSDDERASRASRGWRGYAFSKKQ
jgi:hypothetical protein